MFTKPILLAGVMLSAITASAGIENVGSAGYFTTFPGTDAANRNGYPQGTPYLSGKAADKPVPTNDWWSNELLNAHGQSMFNYPLALKPVDAGLVIVRNMTQQAITSENPMIVRLQGMSSPATTVCDYSDWTVTFRWDGNGGSAMEATAGVGMPFVYFTREGQSPVEIAVTSGSISADGNIAVISGAYNRADYALYAPSGARWTVEGNVLRSDLGGKDYWSAVMLPENSGDLLAKARQWQQYAYVFPGDTRAEWNYDSSRGEVKTIYSVSPDVKEGAYDKVLMGLLPHHWGNLQSPVPFEGSEYQTVRGALRMAGTNEFATIRKFCGILPMLPAAIGESETFSQAELDRLIGVVNANTGFDDWTDSYNDGQLLNRLTQTAYVAKYSGNEAAFKTSLDLVRTQLERWFTASEGDVAFVFYYHKPWNAMLAYPAGHGQDTNLNDHNFHFGYFINAAALVARYDSEWARKWGPMVDLLVRDVASTDRNDTMFPYLRSFSPYAGHCWANGFGTLGLGNDQESSSESMMCHAAMILWAEATGNTTLRDAAVWMYATEQSAVEEYWFDVHNRVFPSDYRSAVVSRVFANGFDDENFWGGGIAGSYGIEIYPVQPSSTYLVNNRDFAARLWQSMCGRTGILANEDNPNIWYDAWIQFLAMQDPEAAIRLYGSAINLGAKFGASQALTYYWIHSLNAVGVPDMTVTADYPLAAAFELDGRMTYAADNYTASPLKVTFSDGHILEVAPLSSKYESDGEVRTSVRIAADGYADGATVAPGTEITLSATVRTGAAGIGKLVFTCDGTEIASLAEEPWQTVWTPAGEGTYRIGAYVIDPAGVRTEATPITINVVAGAPVTPPGGDTEACRTVSDKASEGSFDAPYTIEFVTAADGTTVKVTARFDNRDSYVGFAGPWLFDETEGFREIAMTDNGDGSSSVSLSGYDAGTTVKVRVKIAYAGGLGVTVPVEYEVGSSCKGSGLVAVGADDVRVYPNPVRDVLYISCDGYAFVAVYDIAGCRMVSAVADGSATVDVRAWKPGTYILRVEKADGSVKVEKIIKL